LEEHGILPENLSGVMVDVLVHGEDQNLISYGPLFGIEAQENLIAGLIELGLVEVDDFVGFNFFVPDWLQVRVAFVA
jgi:hypothetical protein